MAERLRVGVIGLGRRWRTRYGPALAALRDRFAVRAVADPSAGRAAAVAHELGCAAAPGVLSLLEGDLDAVLLLGRPWYRLWPLEHACRLGRPTYCAVSLADDPRADALVQQVRVRSLPVMAELLPRLAPATERLRGLLERIGPLRSLICAAERPGPGRDPAAVQAAGLALFDWVAHLLGQPLAAPRGLGEPSSGHASWLLEFRGTVAQVATWPGGGRHRRVWLRAVGERGAADVLLPRRLSWRIGHPRRGR